MIRFAIYGAGQKGRLALDILGREKVSCFIDSNISLQGVNLHSVPVVSFEEYCNEYKDSLIIVSMLDCKTVISNLNNEGIPYIMWEESSKILENDFTTLDDFLSIVGRRIDNRNIAIWGVNILSIALYDFVAEKCNKLSFVSCEIDNPLNRLLTKNGYRFDEHPIEKIIVTNDGWEKAVVRYPNIKITDINDLLLEIVSKDYSELSKFKDVHKNKRCFIIGNGPSLRVEDLEVLYREDEICFATNMIYKVFPKINWRPQYYVASDMAVLKNYGEQIKQLQLPCLFIGSRRTNFWDGFINHRFYAFYDYRCLNMDVPSFSEDITRCIYSYYTVTYTCLQIAMYMGFREIYLLGVDANYSGYASDENNHFISDYYDPGDSQRIPPGLEKHFRAYQSANNYASRHSVNIYNATRGGKLEVFERVDFDSLFVGK